MMETSSTKSSWREQLFNIAKIGGLIAIIAGILALGEKFGSNKFDQEKISLEKENDNLKDSVEALQYRLRNDSINLKNIIALNTHNLSINSPASMPTITVANSRLNPCAFGEINGCWKTQIKGKSGDIIGIQIYCRNSGNFSVDDVYLGCNIRYSQSGRTLNVIGGVRVGNIIINEGTASIYMPSSLSYVYLPQSVFLASNDHRYQHLDSNANVLLNGYKLDSLGVNQEFVLVFGIKLK